MIRMIALWLVLVCAAPVAAEDATALARLTGGSVTDARGGGVNVEITLDQGVPWRLFTVENPWRVVVDFRELATGAVDAGALDRSEAITGIRLGPYRTGWSRLILGLDAPMAVAEAGMRVDPDTGAATLRLALVPSDAAGFAAGAGLPADPDWGVPKLVLPEPVPGDDDRLVVVLDPGHGGIDPGAQRAGVNEADLMLTFARELREVLRRTGRYRVVLTRDDDVFVSLEARVALTQSVGADLFLSLHADALAEGVAHGATVYTLAEEASDAASAAMAERHNRDDLLVGLDLTGTDDRVAQVLMDLARLDNTPRSQALAGHLVAGIENAVGRVHKRPLRQAAFSVLKAPGVPSALLEVGFLSTDRDLRNLQDSAWRAAMAAGIRDGIEDWAQEDMALQDLRRR
jgi:N-acetylmuramoyl-L-alanine amidase